MPIEAIDGNQRTRPKRLDTRGMRGENLGPQSFLSVDAHPSVFRSRDCHFMRKSQKIGWRKRVKNTNQGNARNRAKQDRFFDWSVRVLMHADSLLVEGGSLGYSIWHGL